MPERGYMFPTRYIVAAFYAGAYPIFMGDGTLLGCVLFFYQCRVRRLFTWLYSPDTLCHLPYGKRTTIRNLGAGTAHLGLTTTVGDLTLNSQCRKIADEAQPSHKRSYIGNRASSIEDTQQALVRLKCLNTPPKSRAVAETLRRRLRPFAVPGPFGA